MVTFAARLAALERVRRRCPDRCHRPPPFDYRAAIAVIAPPATPAPEPPSCRRCGGPARRLRVMAYDGSDGREEREA